MIDNEYSTPVDFIARFLLELKQRYFNSDSDDAHTQVRKMIDYSVNMLNNRESLFSVDPTLQQFVADKQPRDD